MLFCICICTYMYVYIYICVYMYLCVVGDKSVVTTIVYIQFFHQIYYVCVCLGLCYVCECVCVNICMLSLLDFVIRFLCYLRRNLEISCKWPRVTCKFNI